MKSKLFILAAVCSLSASVMGQMKIGNFDGKILVGNYNEATLIIKNTGKAILSGGLVEGGGTLRIENTITTLEFRADMSRLHRQSGAGV